MMAQLLIFLFTFYLLEYVIIQKQFSKSLMSSQTLQAHTIALPLYNQLAASRNEQGCIQQSSSISTAFNGIIFREASLLEALGVTQAIQKHEASMPFAAKRQLGTCLSISIKLSFEVILKWNAKITLKEYNESFFANIKFAYIQRNYKFSGHQFTKINLVAQSISKDIKILLSKQAYPQLIRTINKKGIKYYIKPTPSFLTYYCSKNFTLSQLSFQSDLAFQPFDNKIEYSNSCTFNGKQNCFVVFTATKVLVFHNRNLLKEISKETFLQKEYWIENKDDWISFERQDQFFVFQRKFDEVTYRNNGIIQQDIPFSESQQSEFIQKTVKKQPQMNKQALHYRHSDIKDIPEKMESFMSQEIQNQQQMIIEEIQQPTIKRKLFCEEDQSMQDESEYFNESQADKIKQIMLNKQIIDNYIIQEEKEQSNVNQEPNQEIVEESFLHNKMEVCIEKDQIKMEQDHDACQFNSNTFNTTLSLNVESKIQNYNTFSKNDDIDKMQNIAFVEEENENYQLNMKENFKMFANNGYKRDAELLKKELNSEISIQEQYVYQPNQYLINLSSRIQDFTTNNSLLGSYSLMFDEVQTKEKLQKVMPKKVLQISSSILTVLSTENEAHIFQRQNSHSYQHENYYIQNVVKVFKGQSQNNFFYCDQKDQHMYELNIKTSENKRVNTDFLKGQEIKDAKALNYNELAFLSCDSIQILDRRTLKDVNVASFETNQLFQKFDIHQKIAAVGRKDGIVKLYDLRSLKSRSLNNFDLNSELNYHYPQSFKQVRIQENLNIFCQYNNSAIIIHSEDKGSKSIYTSKLKKAERSFLQQYSVSSQIIRSIDKYSPLHSEMSFSTNRAGTSVMSFYKGYEFHFDIKSEKAKKWGELNVEYDQKCVHAEFNNYYEEERMIVGTYSKEGLNFRETQKQ